MNVLTDVAEMEPPKILLIDLENCPSQINDLLSKLDSYSQIVICYAQSGAKVPLDWLMPLSEAIASQRLKIIKMSSVGKNAADFGICFFAGALMQQFPPGTCFTVLSDDADLDHVVRLLVGEGRIASRVGSKKEEKPAASAGDTGGESVGPRTMASFCAALLAYPNNRPAKEEALRNHLRSHFQQSQSLADHVFSQLVQAGAIVLSEGKMRYVDARLKGLSVAA